MIKLLYYRNTQWDGSYKNASVPGIYSPSAEIVLIIFDRANFNTYVPIISAIYLMGRFDQQRPSYIFGSCDDIHEKCKEYFYTQPTVSDARIIFC